MSHAGFLRDHHSGPTADVVRLVRALLHAAEDAALHPLKTGLSRVHTAIDAALDDATSLAEHRTLVHFAARLTLAPRTSRQAHLQALRDAGYSDRELHDVVQVVCCFSFMNRLADGLGVTDPTEREGAWALELMGEARCAAHVVWATPPSQQG